MEYGCIAQKLTHSFSKIIHNKLCDYEYKLLELEPWELADFFQKKDFKAINVTIPYKQEVIHYLDKISKTAMEIGAVNTIVNKNGRLYGYNTDFLGMKALIDKNSMDFEGKKVVILGSGGTSKTAAAVAKSLGACEILRVSRHAQDGCIDYGMLYQDHIDAQVIINTTPCGMYPDLSGAAAEIDRFPGLCAVIDAVYNPLRSRLVLHAKNQGIPACGGLYMLVAQAVFAAEKFIDRSFTVEQIGRVYKEVLKEKENIVLIGMPGCGKSTLGQRLAKQLNRYFVDTDNLIVAKAGCPIPQIFEEHGEQHFRDLESQVISELARESSYVIATGGGAVLREQNVFALKQNGRLCFINRPLEQLVSTSSRPLSDTRDKIEALYSTRLPVYKLACDIELDGDCDIDTNLSLILKEYGFEY